MKGNIGLHFSYASINTESSVDTENGTVEAMVDTAHCLFGPVVSAVIFVYYFLQFYD